MYGRVNMCHPSTTVYGVRAVELLALAVVVLPSEAPPNIPKNPIDGASKIRLIQRRATGSRDYTTGSVYVDGWGTRTQSCHRLAKVSQLVRCHTNRRLRATIWHPYN